MFKKNDVCKVSLVDIGQKGEGIGKSEGFTFFIDGALPQEEVTVKVLKVKKNYGFGKILKVIKPSPVRVEPACSVFGKCGGCDIMHMDYQAQLFYKEKKVKDSIERIGGFKEIENKVASIAGMDNPYFYRNKVQIPVREENGEIKTGFYAKNSHRIVDMDGCKIQPEISKKILNIVKSYMVDNHIRGYNEERHMGIVRHVLIKYGYTTKEIMVCLVVNLESGKSLKNEGSLIEMLSAIEGVSSISLNYNNERTNVILGESIRNIYGKPYIEDYIGETVFRISPLSFYQVNPVQVKVLYDKVAEYCNLQGNETVIDAYCGIGSISLYIAKKAQKVIGIEIVEDAVKDAEINAKENNVSNAEFILGSAEEVMPDLEADQNIKPDIIIVDPPRKGCDVRMLESILTSSPDKVVYVSCNPDTLARDLKILCENVYEIVNIQPVDMFPHTTNVECVCLLKKK